MRLRGDSAIVLTVMAVGMAPAIIKKSKPLARYLGDQLIRAGQYLHHGMEETPEEAAAEAAPVYVADAVAEEVIPMTDIENDNESIGSATVEGSNEPSLGEPTDPESPSVTDETIEGESGKTWD